jgi:type IV pilus assembly protein PilQ
MSRRHVTRGLATLALWLSVLGGNATPADAQSTLELHRTGDPARTPIFRDAVPGPPRNYVGEPISLSLKNADLVEVLRSFAQLAQFNLIVQPGVKGKVTVELKDVPWDQALEAILKMHGLGLDVSLGTVRIAPPLELRRMAEQERRDEGSLTQRQLVQGRLEHADAALVAQLLNRPDLGLLSSSGYAAAHDQELTVAELPARIQKVARLVARLDRPDTPRDPAALARRAVELWRSGNL